MRTSLDRKKKQEDAEKTSSYNESKPVEIEKSKSEIKPNQSEVKRNSVEVNKPKTEDELASDIFGDSQPKLDSVIQKELDNQDTTAKRFMETYQEMEETVEKKRAEDMGGMNLDSVLEDELGSDQDSQQEDDPEDDYDEDEYEDEEPHHLSTKAVIGIAAGVVVVVGIGGFAVYKHMTKPVDTVDGVIKQVDRLYTSKDKTDLKDGLSQSDLNEYYLELNSAEKKGEDISSVSDELDTIGYYLNDRSVLDTYNDASYDLTTVGMQDSINEIKSHTSNYSVSGLAITVTDLANDIVKDYDDFIATRQKLNGVTDVLNFDEGSYKAEINEVRHVPNRTELLAIYDKIVVDKKAAEAQKELQEADDDAKKKEAEKALQDAQELQKQTQQELDDTKKKLEEEAQKAAELIKSLKDKSPLNSEKINTPTPTPTLSEEPTEAPKEPVDSSSVAPETSSSSANLGDDVGEE